MIGAAVFAGAFTAAFLALALFVDPRALWWRFRARHFQHPEAHEPSTPSFMGRRVVPAGRRIGVQAGQRSAARDVMDDCHESPGVT
ncbi:hypothetical protein [Streptomyces lavendofoliae]|uniref:hypothetical protein n=1 Tax=Streptomyces lavendofoliae TaxID=67314 RepID=UPI003D8F35BF